MLRDGGRGSAGAYAHAVKSLGHKALSFFRYCLLVVFLCALGVGYARAQTYAYDGNGRLVAATTADGNTSQYVYDNMGSLQQVLSVPSGQLQIFAFAPNHGAPGLTVTVSGQGFSTTALSNSVSFNGAPAPVLSATTNTLVTQVPASATTGPVSVTVGSHIATSLDAFVVDGSGLPPVITSVTPGIVAPGTTITVAGQHLAPVPGQTNVTLNGQPVATTSVTDSSITFAAPSTIGSGRVAVQTAFGVANSAADLVIVPNQIGAANVTVAARLQMGSTQALSTLTGKYGVMLFDAGDTRATSWISVQLNALSVASTLSYNVYDANNQPVVSGTLYPSLPTIHLPKLRKAGTYSIYVSGAASSGAASAASLTLGLEAAIPVTVYDPNPTAVITTINNQSRRLLFSAIPGLVLQMPALATTPQGQNVTASVYDVAGSLQVTTTTKSPGAALNMPSLKPGADYLAVVAPASGATENVSAQLTRLPGGELVIDGPSLSTTAPTGVLAYFTFDAAPGDNLELALSGIKNSLTSSTASNVRVYDSRGNLIASNIYCYPSNSGASCRVGLPGLAGGHYTVNIVPDQASTQSFQITLTRDLVGTLVMNQAQTVNLTRPGQSMRLSFTGTVGQLSTLSLNNPTVTPSGSNLTVAVLRPDGTTLISTGLNKSGVMNLPSLPVTGTYVVLITSDYGLPGSVQVVLTPGAVVNLDPDGASQSLTTFAGQNGYFPFSAKAGDNLEFALSNVVAPSCSLFNINVYDSKNVLVSGGTWYYYSPGKGFHLRLWGLAGGDYQMVLSGCAITATGTLTRDITGTLAFNQPLSFDLTRPGLTERLTVNAVSGQNLALAVTNPTTTPTGAGIDVSVYQPNGNKIFSSNVTVNQVLNVQNLPVTGSYTVIVTQGYGLPASAQLNLLPQLGGAIVADGDSQTISGPQGQNVYYSFTAAAGENLEVGVNGLTMSASNGSTTVNVYDAKGTYVAGTNLAVSSYPGSIRIGLWNLAAGNYQIVLGSSSGVDSFNATTTLSHDVTAALTPGVSLPISLTRIAQAARLTFNGTAGQNMVLTVGNYATTPSGQNLNVYINKPDGSRWQNTTPSSGANGGTVSMQNMPQSGTYTVILAPYYGVTASMNATVQ